MPELPDVEGFRRYWRGRASGRRVQRVSSPDQDVLRNTTASGLGRSLSGRRFEEPSRWGKWLLAPTDGRTTLLLHFGMTGLLVGDDTVEARTDHDRVVFTLDDGWLAYRTQRKLGGVWAVRSDREREDVTGPLGPDAGTLEIPEIRGRLARRRGAVKSSLMNQEVMAGIGNELSDEILWRAGVHPRERLQDLDEEALEQVARATRAAIAESVPTGRIPDEGGWLNSVRGDPDPRCPRCGAEIVTGTAAGRTAYWCSQEQGSS